MYPEIQLPIVNGPTELGATLLKILDEGQVHHQHGRYWEAEKIYRSVLEIYPGHERATALIALLRHSRDPEDADQRKIMIHILEDQADKDPNDLVILSNLTSLLMLDKRLISGIQRGIQTIEAWPGHAQTYLTIAGSLAETGRHNLALYGLEHALKLDPGRVEILGEYIFISDLTSGITAKKSYENRRLYNERFIRPHMSDTVTHDNDINLNRKIRVGYISSDFYQHSAFTTFFLMLQKYDREKFEVYAYGSVEKEDNNTQAIKDHTEKYVDINHLNDDQISARIIGDKIDILVDLSGFTKGTHLGTFAKRPAPVQASGWGYATGMSLDCFDWFFADDMTVLPEEEIYFSERIYRLPCTLSWSPALDEIDTSPSLSIYGRPFTFGSFSRFHKITKETMDAWCEILRRSPDSRLLIKAGVCGNPEVAEYIKQEFIRRGVWYFPRKQDEQGNSIPRIRMLDASDHGTHLASHWRVDLMLDPFPHGNGVSAFESIWMGVPLLTLYGATVPGRITSSIFRYVGLSDLSVNTVEEYINKAVEFSKHPHALLPYREGLRERLLASPMMQPEQYVRAVEAGYIHMMETWVRERS
jgi:predicted O-linked N-acetylglucosamine transferase (SPINDLY family)